MASNFLTTKWLIFDMYSAIYDIYTIYSSCYRWSLGIFLRNSPLHECDRRQYFLFFLDTLIHICINTIYIKFFAKKFGYSTEYKMNTIVPATARGHNENKMRKSHMLLLLHHNELAHGRARAHYHDQA